MSSVLALGPVPVQQFFDNAGAPLAGGLLYTYQAGTTTPLTVYQDVNGVTPWSNPVVLDSAGRIPGEIFPPASVSMKQVLKTSAGVTLWTADNIPPSAITSDRVPQTVTSVGTINNLSLLTGASFLRMTNATAAVITGLTAGVDGQQLVIAALGAGTLTLNNNDAGSSVGNKIRTGTGAALLLPAGTGCVIAEYDATLGLWIVVAPSVLTNNATNAWAHVTNAGTPTLAGSMNVASLTDNGVGDTTVTFTTALASANYAASIGVSADTGGGAATRIGGFKPGTHLAGSIRVITQDTAANVRDCDFDVSCIGG